MNFLFPHLDSPNLTTDISLRDGGDISVTAVTVNDSVPAMAGNDQQAKTKTGVEYDQDGNPFEYLGNELDDGNDTDQNLLYDGSVVSSLSDLGHLPEGLWGQDRIITKEYTVGDPCTVGTWPRKTYLCHKENPPKFLSLIHI